jgi:hypothetical protein
MNVQKRVELGIGYYYKDNKNRFIYIPIERGQSVVEPWLDNHSEEWFKVEDRD